MLHEVTGCLLHQYTPHFEGMTWKDMVMMDEQALEARSSRRTYTTTGSSAGNTCPNSQKPALSITQDHVGRCDEGRNTMGAAAHQHAKLVTSFRIGMAS